MLGAWVRDSRLVTFLDPLHPLEETRAAGTGRAWCREGNALQSTPVLLLKVAAEVPSAAGWPLKDGCAPSKKRSASDLCSQTDGAVPLCQPVQQTRRGPHLCTTSSEAPPNSKGTSGVAFAVLSAPL